MPAWRVCVSGSRGGSIVKFLVPDTLRSPLTATNLETPARPWRTTCLRRAAICRLRRLPAPLPLPPTIPPAAAAVPPASRPRRQGANASAAYSGCIKRRRHQPTPERTLPRPQPANKPVPPAKLRCRRDSTLPAPAFMLLLFEPPCYHPMQE